MRLMDFGRILLQALSGISKILRKNNALDFDDLLVETVRLFREFPEVLTYYRKQFKHILVDEYQDTNRAQYELVNILAQENRNLCVCGDPDQSIYEWRGADIRNILDFEKDYPDATVIKLEQNYRSTQTILDIANNVISRNRSRKEKDLWTENAQGPQAICYQAYNGRDEASFVAGEIERAMIGRDSLGYGDFVVLYRTNAQSRLFEEVLMSRGIPYKVVGGLKFYERKEIKDVLSYLRLLLNPDDMVSLSRVVNVPKRGVGEATLAKYVDYANENNIHLLTAFQDPTAVSGVPTKTKQALMGFGEFIESLGAKVHDRPVTELLRNLLELSGYVKALEEENTVESMSRADNVKELLSVTREYDARDAEGRGVAGFLEEAALIADVDLFDEDQEGVTLMTLHSAKGLEFPTVFLVGMEEGLLPHSRTLIDEDGLEEERRLCYVGITRAEKVLYFTFAAQRMLYGEIMTFAPSRFLEDVPIELLTAANRVADHTVVGHSTFGSGTGRSGMARPGRMGLASRPNTTTMGGMGGPLLTRKSGGGEGEFYQPGDKVRSPHWGIGTVISSEGEGEKLIIKVAFPNQGIKRLLASIAPIEKVT